MIVLGCIQIQVIEACGGLYGILLAVIATLRWAKSRDRGRGTRDERETLATRRRAEARGKGRESRGDHRASASRSQLG